jgi:DNA-directed RNA polymerase specialized sigma subunit
VKRGRPLSERESSLAADNFRLAYHAVKRFKMRSPSLFAAMGADACENVAMDGLLAAARAWRPNGGAAFSTYAMRACWMRLVREAKLHNGRQRVHERAMERPGHWDGSAARAPSPERQAEAWPWRR